ncbi:hypothetical protein [Erwinia sorbitola]|uniref:Uncharacterized protein n=1 Tax=Erwinia sorbitola TaxID=2681984 RepID=A0A6I6ELT9_9GAMM|nr:hypothetical protein [Erwinia sorbitola]QGU89105.1 hypothetical protein GN242_18580 [Erwinia sorbitola]
MLMKFFSMILHGLGQLLFGGSIIIFAWFVFFSESEYKYIYAIPAAFLFALAFCLYYFGDRISDKLFWRKKDQRSELNRNKYNK